MDIDFTPAKRSEIELSVRNKLIITTITLLLNCLFLIGVYFEFMIYYKQFIYFNLLGFMLFILYFLILNLFYKRIFNIIFIRIIGLSIFVSTIIYTMLYVICNIIYLFNNLTYTIISMLSL